MDAFGGNGQLLRLRSRITEFSLGCGEHRATPCGKKSRPPHRCPLADRFHFGCGCALELERYLLVNAKAASRACNRQHSPAQHCRTAFRDGQRQRRQPSAGVAFGHVRVGDAGGVGRIQPGDRNESKRSRQARPRAIQLRIAGDMGCAPRWRLQRYRPAAHADRPASGGNRRASVVRNRFEQRNDHNPTRPERRTNASIWSRYLVPFTLS